MDGGLNMILVQICGIIGVVILLAILPFFTYYVIKGKQRNVFGLR